MTGGCDGGRVTPMWMAHHYPEDYDRCVVVGRNHVCRRCLVLYPIAFVVMVATMFVAPDSTMSDRVVMIVLPLPAVVDFIAEHLGYVEYRPWRQVLVTVPLAVALGRGFAIYVNRPASALFWGTVVVYGGICTAVMLGSRFVGRK